MPSRATCDEKLVCTARVSRAARDDDVVRNARAPLDARGRRRGGLRRAFGERASSRMVNSQISFVEPRSSRGPSDRLPIRKTPLGGSFRGFSPPPIAPSNVRAPVTVTDAARSYGSVDSPCGLEKFLQRRGSKVTDPQDPRSLEKKACDGSVTSLDRHWPRRF